MSQQLAMTSHRRSAQTYLEQRGPADQGSAEGREAVQLQASAKDPAQSLAEGWAGLSLGGGGTVICGLVSTSHQVGEAIDKQSEYTRAHREAVA